MEGVDLKTHPPKVSASQTPYSPQQQMGPPPPRGSGPPLSLVGGEGGERHLISLTAEPWPSISLFPFGPIIMITENMNKAYFS